MSLSSERPIIFAHRGASGYEYENSTSAFNYAITLGADGIETDCWLSEDGEVVVHHDLLIKASPSLNIQKMTLQEIQNLSLPNGDKILSLRELFEQFGSNDILSNRLDPLKFSIDVQDNKVGPSIANLVEEFGLIDRVDLCCDTLWKMKNIRKINQRVRLVASNLEHMIKPKHLVSGGKMASFKIEAFNIKAEYFSPKMKEALNQYGYKYYIWDLHSSRILRQYLPYSPDAIYSNFPDKAIKALNSMI
ncbi:hypothetical protein NEF87_003300 [Candidatus Lokiarchaeum ossiferum]|uniref:GP-PDE domain-containing protein n=1 Tax=Candidatus Lokiarchaeum ossiferum TaxID=2951803 RepID=A0ABY6HUB6_9ARCH|nr:hypothetical protein NEF87_003300 [Candidatus Lokiarchaeum sp. B-35]